MAKSKHDMLTQMRLMCTSLTKFHEQLKIKEDTFELPKLELLEPLHVNFIREGFKWIQKIYQEEFLKFNNVWKLVPPEQWARYRYMPDVDDLREVVMLKEATHKLRTKLVSRDRPDFFKKGKLNGEVKKKLKEGTEKKA
jgi:hypothetical protein